MSLIRSSRSLQAWTGLVTLWIVGFVGSLIRFIMAYYQVQISEDLGVERGFISAAGSTNMFIAAACAPLGGWMADRFGPKRVLIASAACGILASGTVYLAGGQPIFFFLGYGIIAGLVGLSASATYLLLFDWFHRHQSKLAALLASASSIGLAVCTPLFVTYKWLTWKDAFLTSAILGLLITLPMIILLVRNPHSAKKEDHNRETDSVTPLHEAAIAAPDGGQAEAGALTELEADLPNTAARVVEPKNFGRRKGSLLVLGIVGFALFSCGFNMGTVEMNLVAIHRLANVPDGTLQWSVSLLGIMEIVGSFGFGFILDWVNRRLALALLYAIRIAAFLVLLLHADVSPILFSFMFGITYLGAVPGGLLLASEYTGGRGKQVGYLIMCHQGGGILGTLIGGLSFDQFGSYQLLIGLDAALCAIAAFFYLMLYLRSISITRMQTVKASEQAM